MHLPNLSTKTKYNQLQYGRGVVVFVVVVVVVVLIAAFVSVGSVAFALLGAV